MFSAKEILDIAIRLEKNGRRVYCEAIQNCPRSPMASVLGWMIEEEDEHIRWFSGLQRGLAETTSPIMEEMGREVFGDLLERQTFSLEEVDLCAVTDTAELVARFIEFETDTILFYEMLAPFVQEGEPRKVLEKIIAEEYRHIEKLNEFLAANAGAAV
jgi:rubrerythrin